MTNDPPVFELERMGAARRELADLILAGQHVVLTLDGRVVATVLPSSASGSAMEQSAIYGAPAGLSSTALTRLLGSHGTRAVLGVFLKHRGERLYQREVARRAGIGLRSAQLALERLVELGVLCSLRDGNRLYYEAARSPRLEQLRELLDGELGIREVLVRHLHALERPVQWAFIFGSLASETDTIDSDIDVFIVTDADRLAIATEMAAAGRELDREIDTSVYRPEQLMERLADKNHFITSVLLGPRIDLIGGPPDGA